jgi:hypothetical protein
VRFVAGGAPIVAATEVVDDAAVGVIGEIGVRVVGDLALILAERRLVPGRKR